MKNTSKSIATLAALALAGTLTACSAGLPDPTFTSSTSSPTTSTTTTSTTTSTTTTSTTTTKTIATPTKPSTATTSASGSDETRTKAIIEPLAKKMSTCSEGKDWMFGTGAQIGVPEILGMYKCETPASTPDADAYTAVIIATDDGKAQIAADAMAKAVGQPMTYVYGPNWVIVAGDDDGPTDAAATKIVKIVGTGQIAKTK